MSDKSQFEPGINAFLEAVNLLFHSNDKDLKVKANKFLVEFEAKAESWDIAYQVLLKDNLPEEVYYNALNILKNKIKSYFGNYSENPENTQAPIVVTEDGEIDEMDQTFEVQLEN